MRFYLKKQVAIYFLVITIGTLCTTLSAQETTPLTLDNITVIDVLETNLPSYRSSTTHIAPDGERFAYFSSGELCIYPVAFDVAPEPEVCAPFPDRFRHSANSVTWSPDNTTIAFTEDVLTLFNDGDIHIFDVESGNFFNLTDDGHRGGVTVDEYPVDIAPEWSQDSQWIYFIRYDNSSEQANLLRVQRDGSVVEMIQAPLENTTFFSTYAIALSGDETQIAYNYFRPGQIGLYINTWESNTITELYLTEDRDKQVEGLRFSRDGSQLLAMLPVTAFYHSGGEVLDASGSVARIFDTQTGELQLIDPERMVLSATWSPDGTLIAYIVQGYLSNDEDELYRGLYVTDEVGKPGKLLFAGAFFNPSSESLSLTWGDNNVIALADIERRYQLTLIQLGADE